MTQAAKDVLQSTLALPADDRAELIDELVAAEDGDGEVPPLSPGWTAEIERRSAELDAGLVKCVPWEQVRDEVRREIDRRG